MRRLIFTDPGAGKRPASRRRNRICTVLASALLVASGCNRAARSGAIEVDASFATPPSSTASGTVRVGLRDAAAKPVSGAHVTVEANMRHPGMKPIFRDATEVAPGQYQAELQLGMRGSWVILLHVRQANGEKLERELTVEAK